MRLQLGAGPPPGRRRRPNNVRGHCSAGTTRSRLMIDSHRRIGLALLLLLACLPALDARSGRRAAALDANIATPSSSALPSPASSPHAIVSCGRPRGSWTLAVCSSIVVARHFKFPPFPFRYSRSCRLHRRQRTQRRWQGRFSSRVLLCRLQLPHRIACLLLRPHRAPWRHRLQEHLRRRALPQHPRTLAPVQLRRQLLLARRRRCPPQCWCRRRRFRAPLLLQCLTLLCGRRRTRQRPPAGRAPFPARRRRLSPHPPRVARQQARRRASPTRRSPRPVGRTRASRRPAPATRRAPPTAPRRATTLLGATRPPVAMWLLPLGATMRRLRAAPFRAPLPLQRPLQQR